MLPREFKDALYAQFARIGQALSSPKRIELLDLLTQGERTVETLAEQTATPIKNTSAHLRALRQARLVETRRDGTYIYYRPADHDVVHFVRGFQELGHRRLAEIAQMARSYMDERDAFEPVTLAELRKLMRNDQVTVIDVRPREEFQAGHIPGALSVPLRELTRRVNELPRHKEVIAYCRGAYCVYALEAVTFLRDRGFRARRADRGVPEWRRSGYPITLGSNLAPGGSRGARRRTKRLSRR